VAFGGPNDCDEEQPYNKQPAVIIFHVKGCLVFRVSREGTEQATQTQACVCGGFGFQVTQIPWTVFEKWWF
jgi:hypothetical protein